VKVGDLVRIHKWTETIKFGKVWDLGIITSDPNKSLIVNDGKCRVYFISKRKLYWVNIKRLKVVSECESR